MVGRDSGGGGSGGGGGGDVLDKVSEEMGNELEMAGAEETCYVIYC